MWIKVFVKALPNTVTSLINSCLAVCLCCCKSQIKDAIRPTITIFAFLTLNTPRSAHQEITCSKFASFERAAIAYWCTDDYAVNERNVQWMMELNKHHKVAIEPLFHPDTASLAIQKGLSCLPIQPLLEGKRGFSYILWGQKRSKTTQKRQDKSLKPIFIL